MTTASPERARLAAALRELKGRTGLSLAGLAAKTAFSKSSWDRYLNARTVPPRDAVQELCRLAGEPEGRCLALWEIAESEGSGRATEQAPAPRDGMPPEGASPDRDSVDDGSVRRSATLVAVLASVCAVAVGGVAAVALLLPHRDGEPRASLSPPPATTGPRCRGEVCEGKSAMQMKCAAGPQTLAAHRTASGAWMELRYSRECGASWARMWGTHIGDRLEMSADGKGGDSGDGGVRSAEIENGVDADNYVYTPMTAARPGTVVRACFHPAAGGGKECFDSRVGK
ncbi:helix-turn-helix domain-containing protein [Streptomyces muensis]|uniref:XRE family transcriptional regulator n=1 Tax=Streptomyces muensis TaxID=1077944 RepID=A0A9X1Q5J4_STRM4|nr:XRE family transcriptional regulator [Streptomyces muensis]MCF1598203.1 XRE family transcriptional regulator [Streptomyces muensis]